MERSVHETVLEQPRRRGQDWNKASAKPRARSTPEQQPCAYRPWICLSAISRLDSRCSRKDDGHTLLDVVNHENSAILAAFWLRLAKPFQGRRGGSFLLRPWRQVLTVLPRLWMSFVEGIFDHSGFPWAFCGVRTCGQFGTYSAS